MKQSEIKPKKGNYSLYPSPLHSEDGSPKQKTKGSKMISKGGKDE